MRKAPNLDKATDFIWKNARLLDRLRFAHLFLGEPKDHVTVALGAYKNADGGFGNSLEPDLRGPNSQPVPVWSALVILDEIDALTPGLAKPLLNYLERITTDEGGVPCVLSSAKDFPHAPWWETGDNPPADLNPTAGIAGLLHRHGVKHPWLKRATDFSWHKIETATETSPYELRCILQFLENVPDQTRAKQAFAKIKTMVEKQDFIELDPMAKGEVHFPLDFAASPDSLGRQLFDDQTIERHLDALVGKQQPDGGWNVNFLIWTPVTECEWRGIHTVERLKTLRAYGRV
jgi:hypothetical protein